MNLFYLIYSSRAVKALDDNELDELLNVARRENEANQITGMLLCFPDMFIQLIEGPEEAIGRLYRNIQNDKRHYGITTLKQGNISKRYFPDWTMGFERKPQVGDTEGTFAITDTRVFSLFRILDQGLG